MWPNPSPNPNLTLNRIWEKNKQTLRSVLSTLGQNLENLRLRSFRYIYFASVIPSLIIFAWKLSTFLNKKRIVVKNGKKSVICPRNPLCSKLWAKFEKSKNTNPVTHPLGPISPKRRAFISKTERVGPRSSSAVGSKLGNFVIVQNAAPPVDQYGSKLPKPLKTKF